MNATLSALIGELLCAKDFEEGATAALRPMLALVESTLAASELGETARLIRGMVHLRPDGGGYRQLVVLERSAPGKGWHLTRNPTSLPSATAWRWVMEHRAPVAVDVNLATVELHAASGEVLATPRQTAPLLLGSGANQESFQRLLGRDATHVFALPLRGARGAVDGMISLEADCAAAMGLPFIWGSCGAALQLLADVVAPHLVTLPLRHVEPGRDLTDELLPVIGSSMAALVEMLRVFAQQEETILIGGPTGAGKSRLARWCHQQSRRRKQRFETLDLVTVPEELQMGELFGWRKGAFTGAVKDNPGCVARAEGGTLFIDEIDKLSLKAQAGLLYVLEERCYKSLGEGAGDRQADVRFIIGTNANLHAAVRAGQFREDLYYRINVLPLKVPPLAERRDEVPDWAHYMLNRRHRESVADGTARLAPDAQRSLSGQQWPGNLRQLDNIVRRAYTLAIMDHGGAAPREVQLGDGHVARALTYETSGAKATLFELLGAAAAQFLVLAERRGAAAAPLDLDLADAFRGFVLGAATEKLGREEAFRVLGKEQLVKSRNHHKALRRELERVQALAEALGQEPPAFCRVDPAE